MSRLGRAARPRNNSHFGRSASALIAAIAFGFAILGPSVGVQANPWNPMTSAVPGPSSIIPSAKEVPGKDFSDSRDREAPGGPDGEQDLAWDGIGGVRDSFDYSGSRVAYPDVIQDRQVDGLAAGVDALFQSLRDDQTALLFSVNSPLGFSDQVYYVRPTSLPNATPGFGVWATAADVDAMNQQMDVDGLELWGPDQIDDSNRYSLADDPFTDYVVLNESHRVAIWEYDSTSHLSIHHTLTEDLAAAIDRQYGGPGVGGELYSQLYELMDVDAIMTLQDKVTFSIAPLTLRPFSLDPLLPLPDFDGGEIFEYDGPGSTTRFLHQGGYVWDTALDVVNTFGVPSENIDALEAVSQYVPEPGSFALMLVGLVAACGCRRQR